MEFHLNLDHIFKMKNICIKFWKGTQEWDWVLVQIEIITLKECKGYPTPK